MRAYRHSHCAINRYRALVASSRCKSNAQYPSLLNVNVPFHLTSSGEQREKDAFAVSKWTPNKFILGSSHKFYIEFSPNSRSHIQFHLILILLLHEQIISFFFNNEIEVFHLFLSLRYICVFYEHLKEFVSRNMPHYLYIFYSITISQWTTPLVKLINTYHSFSKHSSTPNDFSLLFF